MRECDTVRFELEGKLRLGVVIEVQGDRVRVAYGTTQDHVGPCVPVSDEGSRQGRSFPLRELKRGAKPCSWDLLIAIRKLVESHDASLLEQLVQDAGGIVHMAKLVSPIDGECQPVTRCGRALSMPWQLVDKDAPPTCLWCVAI